MNEESIKTDLRKMFHYISDNDFEIFYNRFEKAIKEQKNITNETQKIDEFEKKARCFNIIIDTYELTFSILSDVLSK